MDKTKHTKDTHAHEGHVRETALPKNMTEGIAQALAMIGKLEGQLDTLGLASLTKDERLHSTGKLRDGEEPVLEVILKTIDTHSTLFTSIADKDGGQDPTKVETAPSREALARRAALVPLFDALERLAKRVGDDILASGEHVKDVTIPAYAIIRANAPLNDELRRSAADALNFYPTKRPKKPVAGNGTPPVTTLRDLTLRADRGRRCVGRRGAPRQIALRQGRGGVLEDVSIGSAVPIDRSAVPIDRSAVPIDRSTVPIDRFTVPIDRSTVPIGQPWLSVGNVAPMRAGGASARTATRRQARRAAS